MVVRALFLLVPLVPLFPAFAGAEIPGPDVPAGLGVNIHFTDPRPGEMKMLADAGFGFVRMDFAWAGIEREKGKYDFAAYDRLLDALQQHHIRALFILAYSNPLYEAQNSVATEPGRQAFARWAAASVQRYAGRGILWEMWNEPNYLTFWQPKPDPESYAKLALATAKAIRQVAPNETLVGPATSTIDLPFLEACFKEGLLEYWSAVSVHPYRQTSPETVTDEYRKLRLLIDKYAPPGKHVPILSGEWGYTTTWNGMNADAQGKLLARQWLVNLSCDIPLSIWYDWHDDSPNPKDDESNFGTVANAYHDGRDPVYDAKPAYVAARTLIASLNGYRFNKRLALDSPDDWLLLFTKGDDVRLVAWTAQSPVGGRGVAHKVMLPTGPGRFNVTDHLGRKLPAIDAGRLAGSLASRVALPLELTDAPQYISPQAPSQFLRILAGWTRLRTDEPVHAPATLTPQLEVRNSTDHPIRLFTWSQDSVMLAPGASHATGNTYRLLQTPYPIRMRQQLHIEGFPPVYQESLLIASNPLDVVPLPAMGDHLPIQIANPSGETFHGLLMFVNPDSKAKAVAVNIAIPQGQTRFVTLLPVPPQTANGYEVQLKLVNAQSELVAETPLRLYHPISLDPTRYQLVSDGDPKVFSQQSMKLVDAPAGLPVPGAKALRIDYRYDAGWKFIRLFPAQPPSLHSPGSHPVALGLWIHADASGNSPRLRFIDSTGQCFQPSVDELTYQGWRYVLFPLDGTQAGYWGGAKDGIVHYPIKLDTLFLLDNPTQKKPTQGTIHIALPTLICAPQSNAQP